MSDTPIEQITWTRKQAARRIGLCVRALDEARRRGRLGFVKFGHGQRSRVVFRNCDLDAYLSRYAVPARADALI